MSGNEMRKDWDEMRKVTRSKHTKWQKIWYRSSQNASEAWMKTVNMTGQIEHIRSKSMTWRWTKEDNDGGFWTGSDGGRVRVRRLRTIETRSVKFRWPNARYSPVSGFCTMMWRCFRLRTSCVFKSCSGGIVRGSNSSFLRAARTSWDTNWGNMVATW
jgi:hypothetical protein